MNNDNQEEKEIEEELESPEEIEFIDNEGEVKDKIKALKAELKEANKIKAEYLDGWQRSRAELLNFKKEQDEKYLSLSRAITESVVDQILPVLDSFNMAFANKPAWELVDKNWRAGVENIYAQLLFSLKELGVEEIKSLGEIFDPNIHQSMEVVEVEEKENDGKIVEVIQNGYSLNGRVIRAAKVKVGLFKENK